MKTGSRVLRLDDPKLLLLWEYWRERRAGREALPIDEIDPASLGPLADNVLLVRREERRFRYVFVGASIRTIYGYQMEGLLLDVALPPNRRDQAIQRYRITCETGRPIFTRNAYRITETLGFLVDRLFLPL